MVLTGLRGVGKTVLLNTFRSMALQRLWGTGKLEARPDQSIRRPVASALHMAVRELAPRHRAPDRIDDFLGKPAVDPHGDPIPRPDGSLTEPLGMPLTEMARGARFRVVRVVEQDPARLGSIDPALRGDVETIVAKALEKEPARRYQSAADLAADIRHALSHEPIQARPPTALEPPEVPLSAVGFSVTVMSLVVPADGSKGRLCHRFVRKRNVVNHLLAELGHRPVGRRNPPVTYAD